MTASHRNRQIHVLIKLLGSCAVVARAMDVEKSTVGRWAKGSRPLTGASGRLVAAILAHPDEYMRYKRPTA